MKKKVITTRAIAIALGAAPLLLVMSPSAGAVGGPSASVSSVNPSAAVTAVSTLPTTKIVGAPAVFKPTALTATAIETTTPCTMAQASFIIKNKETTSETIKIKGTDGLVTSSGSIPAGFGEYVCVSTGYTGVMTVKLSDDNKVHITF
jgi:hypothetical protein